MNLETFTKDDLVVGGLAALLAICLVVLPWFTQSLDGETITAAATGSPDGLLGVLACLAALAVVVDLALERLAPHTTLPMVHTRGHTRFALAAVAGGFVALKWLVHPFHFSAVVSFGWGFYVDVILSAALVYMTLQVRDGAPATFSRPRRR